MITDYNVTACYEDECYDEYYRQSQDWDKLNEIKAEKADREYEDREEN